MEEPENNMTGYEAAKAKFPVGCKVHVDTDRPEWNPGYDCNKVVCGHVRYRDGEEDPTPMICVTLVSYTGAIAGWFSPESLMRVEDA